MRTLAAICIALALASAAQAHETFCTPATTPNPDETRLSVVLDASGALSLQLEGADIPADLAGPWRTDRENLAADIRKHMPREACRLYFRGSPDASYEAVAEFLGMLQKAGYRVAVIIERRRQ